ncbi:unnamed protein product [Rhizopus stolonifer]
MFPFSIGHFTTLNKCNTVLTLTHLIRESDQLVLKKPTKQASIGHFAEKFGKNMEFNWSHFQTKLIEFLSVETLCAQQLLSPPFPKKNQTKVYYVLVHLKNRIDKAHFVNMSNKSLLICQNTYIYVSNISCNLCYIYFFVILILR